MAKIVELEYCTSWGYITTAASLAETILKSQKKEIAQFIIVPSDGGCFEEKIDGDLVFSKLQEGRFPEDEEILAHF